MTASADDDPLARVLEHVRQNGLRLGRGRRRVLEVVCVRDGPFCIPDIIEALPDVDRTTVYRTIRVAVDAGVLGVVGSREGAAIFTRVHDKRCPTCGAPLGHAVRTVDGPRTRRRR